MDEYEDYRNSLKALAWGVVILVVIGLILLAGGA
jgi:hypothetical protein